MQPTAKHTIIAHPLQSGMPSPTLAVTDLSERLLTPAYDPPFVLERACTWLGYPCTDPDTSDRFATCRLVLRRSARRIQRAYRHHYITRDPAPSSASSHQPQELPEWATCPMSREVVREPVLLLPQSHADPAELLCGAATHGEHSRSRTGINGR